MSIDKREAVKKMAELLRAGAVMLPQKCPVKGCNLPLFKLKSGEIICPVHGRVYLVSSDEEAKQVVSRISLATTLENLEKKVVEILSEASEAPREHGYRELIGWLEVLERILKIKKELSTKPASETR